MKAKIDPITGSADVFRVYEVVEGEFDFIQPNQSGKLVRRSFQLHQQDVEELKKLLKTVVAELRAEWK